MEACVLLRTFVSSTRRRTRVVILYLQIAQQVGLRSGKVSGRSLGRGHSETYGDISTHHFCVVGALSQ